MHAAELGTTPIVCKAGVGVLDELPVGSGSYPYS